MKEGEHIEARSALSAFLRSRRARLSPVAVGLPAGPRRRTPGLRREEVAQIAGVGITWYTWFEQGREVQVSTHFIECVARALRLDPAERAHLFALAQNRAPPVMLAPSPEVTPALRRMLDNQPSPSYLKTARWDVLAWSPSFTAVFGDLARTAVEQRNMLWLVFTDRDYRRMMVDWEDEVRAMTAKFRLEFGRHHEDPSFVRLVRELSETVPEFDRWWRLQDVQGRGAGIKRVNHPSAGMIEFVHTTFVVADEPDLRLVVYTPMPGEHARKVDALGRATRQ